ncbi:MAG: ornithine carbamoyltransferase [Planctomycetes bacterium RBG_13_63_9]|nr:MAG: ornithine carbamoyltransferase [Planctomycetes bacterium RBG_13_63_9]
MRNLITLADLTPNEIEHIFSITEDLKTKYTKGIREALLPGRVMAMLFEKPSLRTRVSFEAGMTHLGGTALFLGTEVGFGKRESIADFGRVLAELVDVVVVRAKRHQTVVDLAAHCTCSVINGLTDFAHPCQAMADLYTLRELGGSLAGRTLGWVGDANNVARSLALGCGKLGVRMAVAAPEKYRFDDETLAFFKRHVPNLELTVTSDPVEVVRNAFAVYTDVWASMGQEQEREVRRRDFADYQVNAKLMAHAQKGAVFMHCLPARRGEEVTDEVIDGPQSVVLQQAGNRLHAQKGILAWMLGAKA